jgi:cytochrome P450
MNALLTERPTHVPADRIVDFDFYRPPGFTAQGDVDPQLNLRNQLGDKPEIFWTPHNGGHWVITRGEDMLAILPDHQRFSSRVVFLPRQPRPRFVPLELDPPEHAAYRAVLTPGFTPKTIAGWSDRARAVAVSLIEGFQAQRGCEFVGEFSQHLPIIVFLNMANLPLEDRPMLLAWANTGVRPASQAERTEAGRNIGAYVTAKLAERRAQPGDDLLSRIVTTPVNGKLMSEAEQISMGHGVLAGGLDTVAASMSFAAWFLARHPAHAELLRARPELINNSIDELFRRFSIPNIARVVIADTQMRGVTLKAGDYVFMPVALHGLDEHLFPDALRVDFERKNARNQAVFSRGAHNCPGAALARSEMRVFLEEWLARVPAFRIGAGKTATFGTGIVPAVTNLPLEWD